MPRSYWSVKKYGQLGVGPVLVEHRRGDQRRLVERVGPVLDPDPLPEERVLDVGDVARGEDVRVARAPAGVAVTPLSTASPAACASSTLGAAPMPTTTASAGTTRAVGEPHSRDRAVLALDRLDLAPVRRSTPCSRCRSAKTWAIFGPSTRTSGRSSDSSTVTSAPASRAAEATSRPIQPPPMKTTRAPGGARRGACRCPRWCAAYSTPSRSAPGC